MLYASIVYTNFTYHIFRKSGEKIRESGERIYRFFQGDAACLDSAQFWHLADVKISSRPARTEKNR